MESAGSESSQPYRGVGGSAANAGCFSRPQALQNERQRQGKRVLYPPTTLLCSKFLSFVCSMQQQQAVGVLDVRDASPCSLQFGTDGTDHSRKEAATSSLRSSTRGRSLFTTAFRPSKMEGTALFDCLGCMVVHDWVVFQVNGGFMGLG